ncbi:Mpo1 family 2-hydroxy fatty acid dioxygenase [Sediminitomix flava]|nr:Mpo1-like protein [Sediminitomix flava]
MKSMQQWLDEYGESHKNPTNKLIHWICVPAIFFCVLALFSEIPSDMLKNLFPAAYQPYIHWGTVVVILGLLFYLRISVTMFLGMAAVSSLCLYGIKVLNVWGVIPVWQIALIVFVAAWIGQFYGHKVEGKKPSFFKDLQFLMIGPAWLLGFIYKKIGISY